MSKCNNLRGWTLKSQTADKESLDAAILATLQQSSIKKFLKCLQAAKLGASTDEPETASNEDHHGNADSPAAASQQNATLPGNITTP